MLISSLKRSFDRPTVQFWGAVASALIEVISWLTDVEPRYVTPAAFALTVFFLGRLAWMQFQEAEGYREQNKPKLDMLFLPENDTDSRPYLQTLEFGMSPGGGQVMVEMRDRRYRVGIQNLSAATIPDVSVRLASCRPGGNFVFPEHQLAVQDSSPPGGLADIPPHGTRWFDVVNEVGRASSRPDHFRFCYRNPDFSGLPVPADTYEVVLRADCGGQSVARTFRIEKECHDPQNYGRLRMIPI